MAESPAPVVTGPSLPWQGSTALVVAALAAVYFIWGSTYLALRFALEGFPPFLLNGVRFLVAGSVMYAIAAMRGARTPSRREAWNAARMGALLFVGGVGMVTLALQDGVGSGVAAVAAAAIPVWSALIGGLFGQWPGRREWLGLLVGLAGVVILLQEGDFRASTAGMALVVVGPMLWSLGSVWGTRQAMPSGLMAPAVQLLSGGAALLLVGLLVGERITTRPEIGAWLALAYLTAMGSIVAYTAYVHLLRSVRPALATSYAYVNPLVAVTLGLTLGAEIITGPIFVALPLVLIGVALIAAQERRQRIVATRPGPGPTPLEEAA